MRPCKRIYPQLATSLALTAALLAWHLEPAQACGPFFPSSALNGGDKALLTAPVADFANEISRLLPRTKLHANPPKDIPWGDPYGEGQSDAADVADVLAATHDQGLAKALAAWRKNLRAKDAAGKPMPAAAAPPRGLPLEFSLYENGALLYHQGDLPGARAQWQKILDLPETQRQNRTLWAIYMIGRSYIESDPAKAAETLAQVRHLAKPEGPFADPMGFAAASLGWEARALWKQKQMRPAIDLYLEQAAAGEPCAIWSVRDSAAAILASDELLRQAAKDPVLRSIVTAYLTANGGPYQPFGNSPDSARRTALWLKLMGDIDVKNLPGADRLAWAAYQGADFKSAQRWLTLGGKNGRGTPMGQWIQAKLYLREGAMDKASACLANAAKSFPLTEDWTDKIEDGDDSWRPAFRAAGELAALKLGRGQYTESLDLLFKSEYWWDAAYVAERVLTVDELRAYVDKHWPISGRSDALPVAAKDPDDMRDNWLVHFPEPAQLRNLLARRLTRLGRWKEARPYFDPANQKLLDTYITAIRLGHDKARTPLERARSLFAAAKIARHDGMQLLATECAPDEARVGGSYPVGNLDADRASIQKEGHEKMAPALPDELKRAAASAPDPNTRYHYRYIAANLAWEAALLLPNNSDELSAMLIEAGGWLKNRDPKGADRFYKALVKRCPNTADGHFAADLHWFPPPDPATPSGVPKKNSLNAVHGG